MFFSSVLIIRAALFLSRLFWHHFTSCPPPHTHTNMNLIDQRRYGGPHDVGFLPPLYTGLSFPHIYRLSAFHKTDSVLIADVSKLYTSIAKHHRLEFSFFFCGRFPTQNSLFSTSFALTHGSFLFFTYHIITILVLE